MNSDYKLENIVKGTKVALLFSGGVDSTLVLKVLSDHCTKVGARLTALTVENKAGYNIFCKSLLSLYEFQHVTWIKDYYNKNNFDGNIDSAIRSILKDSAYDLVYTGTTKNPDIPLTGSPLRHTKKQIDSIPKLVCPYADKSKDKVLEDYLKHSCKYLYKFTHSCTVSYVKACGECFQCLEKHWAEEKVGSPYV